MVMSATPSHHAVCAPVSERYVCCFELLSFPSRRFASGPITRQSGAANSSLPSISPPSHLTYHHVLFQLHSILSLHFVFSSCFISEQCCQPCKLVESDLTTHCPCQLKTGPVSTRQIHISIVCTPVFTSSLITVPSRVFRVCGFLSSRTTMFPARTTICIEMRRLTTFALLNVVHL